MITWRNTATINLALWGPPLLWAATLQLGEILPYFDCTHGSHRLAIIAFTALALAVLSGVLAWRIASRQQRPHEISFLAALACLSSGVFAYALTLQAIATMVLTGCEK